MIDGDTWWWMLNDIGEKEITKSLPGVKRKKSQQRN